MTAATMTIRQFLSLCVITSALVPKQTLDVTFKGCKFANLSLYAGTRAKVARFPLMADVAKVVLPKVTAITLHSSTSPSPTASPRTQAKSRGMAATKQPDGQITPNPVQPFAQKYSA